MAGIVIGLVQHGIDLGFESETGITIKRNGKVRGEAVANCIN
jgi:hypothetical protein